MHKAESAPTPPPVNKTLGSNRVINTCAEIKQYSTNAWLWLLIDQILNSNTSRPRLFEH